MKKVLIISGLFMINSYALELTKTKTFKVEVIPTTQSINFNLSNDGYIKDQNILENDFSNSIAAAKATKLCKGGKYSISPNYTWKKSERVFKGYKGRLNLKCSFKDKKDEAKINDLKTRFLNLKNLKLNQGQIVSEISNETKNKYIEGLEHDSIVYGIKYAAKISALTNQKCSVENISFNGIYEQVPIRRHHSEMMILSDSHSEGFSKITTPIKELSQVKLTVNYKFKCDDQSNLRGETK